MVFKSIEVTLRSEYRRHGSAGPKPQKVRSGVSSRFNAYVQEGRLSASQSDENSDSAEQKKKQTVKRTRRDYWDNSGNVHVKRLRYGEDISDAELNKWMIFIGNVSARFEVMGSWDLHAAKHNYKLNKERIMNEYRTNYGDNLSEKQSTNYLLELKKYSFQYTEHQICVTIKSDQQFEGAHRENQTGLYVRTLYSKKVYNQGRQLLQQDTVNKLIEMDDSNDLNLTSSTLRRGGFFKQTSRGLVFVIDETPLGGRLRTEETYPT